jgi:hypothetical protein
MTDEIKIIDQMQDRAYFTIIPNLVDDFGLSVYAIRLYLHLRRVAGEAGSCWQSTRTLAEHCGMSEGSVTKAKEELRNTKLIHITHVKNPHGGRDYHNIEIIDIWKKNIDNYTKEVKASTSSELASTPHELTSTPGEIKKNPLRKGKKENLKNWQPLPVSSPFEAKNASSGDEGNNKVAYYRELNNHQTIKDIKELIGFLPPKLIRERIIQTFPNGLDMDRARDVLEYWVSMGWDPNNFDGWLFDYYLNDKYYVHPRDKQRWDNIQHPEYGKELITIENNE